MWISGGAQAIFMVRKVFHDRHWLVTGQHLVSVWWSLLPFLWGGYWQFSSLVVQSCGSFNLPFLLSLKILNQLQLPLLFWERLDIKTIQVPLWVVSGGFRLSFFNQMMRSGSWSWQKWLKACESQTLSLSLPQNSFFENGRESVRCLKHALFSLFFFFLNSVSFSSEVWIIEWELFVLL